MAIVPFKLWEDMKRWKEEQIQKPRLPPDPNVSATASLQRDLSSVMANEDLSEAEKSQLYGQTLHKFKTAHQKALKETSLFPQSDPSSSKMNQLVIDSVPSTMKRKAQLLVSLLKTNPNVSWEDDGTVKLYGKSIPGSNIIDLVNDVIRHRKGSEPTGWQAFAEGLRDMNIPQDVIGNRERWDWMHRAPETPETDYITPKQKRTIRKTASRIPVSVRSAKSLSVRKRIKDHFSSRTLLSATKKRIKKSFLLHGSVTMKLEQLYYNPKSPAAYAGEQALYKLAKQSSKKVKLQDVRDWLRKQQTYTLHKPIRKKFLRRKTVVAGIDTQWQADLADLSKLSKFNDKHRYLLCIIDVFSKYAWVVPIKDKSGKNFSDCFQICVKKWTMSKKFANR